MKRIAIILTLASALMLGACGGGSGLPNATGKATVRAINAMPGSAEIVFLIEERTIGNLSYRSATAVSSWDDLDYTFNFDAYFAGSNQLTRIASQHIDMVTGQEYTLLISGTLGSPSVDVWETTKRDFAAADTVFQVRFSQNANYFTDPIDYYFAPAGVAPVSGEAVVSLSFGEIAPALDFESGSYVLTITSANDPSNILFTSDETAFAAQSDLVISPFDATANDIAEFTVQVFGLTSASARLVDSSIPASVEFLHAAMDLGTSDIYDDETLQSQALANHAYMDLSSEIPITPGVNTFRYVPAGGTSAITLEGDLDASSNTRYRFIAGGPSTAFVTLVTITDRQPIDTAAKIAFFQASNNYAFLDLYLVNQGETIDGKSPSRTGFPPLATAPALSVAPGNYDAYVTELGKTDILAGPVNVNLALGDVVDLVVFDTAVPDVLNLQIYGAP
jgi:hypothetical protein